MSEKHERAFSTGQVLSVTGDRLMCPIGEVYEILNYMADESLMTHQLPRVAREARPILLARHPWLADIDLSDVGPDNWRARLSEIIAQHGETVMVPRMNSDEHEQIDPISELAEKVRPNRIIIAKVSPNE